MSWSAKVSPERSVSAGRDAAREAADRAENVHRHRAALVVADHSTSVTDCRELLVMLGLSGRVPSTAAPERLP
ncbi:hypothetical protein KCV87_05200 [Actinosynnema pretiosum subsp. pretiosum]|uniref:Uncharacterized protein n=2 Tax=Actinosynnema TaxID=40566 RepID=C6WRN9_ACTMD|nr:hypothetical protein [Actinosynnema mirum]ACU36881.1 hypothetical protein Amir_2960 [Actinosynnema mirum DSM 43827]AXX30349.1 hypothetical protein APASM_2984 [Actinosynnema pretiosum subsp. pretiosum]QUF05500.1 hypothetical protein KCV87_05200 [Actinosynnema pretiosum subsp. pretiosum]